MIRLERHEDVAIPGAERAVGEVLGVECAVGQADVIENAVDLLIRYLFADFSLDEIK